MTVSPQAIRATTLVTVVAALMLTTACEGAESPPLDANDVLRVAESECVEPGKEYCVFGFSYGAADAEALASGSTDMPKDEAFESGLAAAEAELLTVFNVGDLGKARMRTAYRQGWDWYLAQT
jgi:hypothetical protein